MDYQHHYDVLIVRSCGRILENYTERHHIVPRCMGGTDDSINLVDLTPEEHFLAHQLLVKIHPKNPYLAKAAEMMCVDRYGHRVNNKKYGWLKRRIAEANSKLRAGQPSSFKGKKHTAKAKAKISAARSGVPTNTCWIHNNTINKKVKLCEVDEYLNNGWVKGRLVSKATRKKLSEAGKGQKRPPSAEHRRKNSEGQLGKVLSAEHKNKISKGLKKAYRQGIR